MPEPALDPTCLTDPCRWMARRAAVREPWTVGMGRLLLWRAPVTAVQMLAAWEGLRRLLAAVRDLDGPLWAAILRQAPAGFLGPESRPEVEAVLRTLPTLPPGARILPWILLLAPLEVLGLLLHDGAWDHGCLWLLRGARGGWRATAAAEAEALRVGTLGVVLGLAAFLPWAGCGTAFLLALVTAWFWAYRGYALAAWHGCPVWKGVLATVLHAVLLVLGALGLLAALALVLAWAAGGGEGSLMA